MVIRRKVYECKKQHGEWYGGMVIITRYIGSISIDGIEIYSQLFESKEEALDKIYAIQIW